MDDSGPVSWKLSSRKTELPRKHEAMNHGLRRRFLTRCFSAARSSGDLSASIKAFSLLAAANFSAGNDVVPADQ
jgi:hypothetical protein